MKRKRFLDDLPSRKYMRLSQPGQIILVQTSFFWGSFYLAGGEEPRVYSHLHMGLKPHFLNLDKWELRGTVRLYLYPITQPQLWSNRQFWLLNPPFVLDWVSTGCFFLIRSPCRSKKSQFPQFLMEKHTYQLVMTNSLPWKDPPCY